ncbi:Glycosaminoglycan xylosylkinase [Orchesella cincta]|uniref:Glycosaminoglycan xylosylkinase n=1 Tax=Orchesella cincta TaxID=48709 RepID=A0A1D2MMT4_ORCCI|nr:Glycosaminoglycan xylosylkinase [Orchesella cincta]
MANMGELLTYANKAKILQAKNSKKGTQLKIEVLLEGDQLALFKPQWYPRDVKISGKAFSGKDRHFGEIASFYLNLILGYNVAPITAGRNVNLMTEILPYASEQLKQTFYRESMTDGSLCFYGVCYYCKPEDVVCARENDVVEGSMVLMLDKKFKMFMSPWKRIYKDGKYAEWETDLNFCSKVLKEKTTSRRREIILDIIAIHVFDFLIGNGDRHHFEILRRNDPNANGHSRNFVLIDNGKSFGNPDEDFIDILTPLYQCCAIRQPLLAILKKFQGNLGRSLEVIGAVDPIQPLLTPAHFRALDRRLTIVLATVQNCLKNPDRNVFGRVVW